jgi:hypothetical protein
VASLGFGGAWGEERHRAVGRDPTDQGEPRDGSESSGAVSRWVDDPVAPTVATAGPPDQGCPPIPYIHTQLSGGRRRSEGCSVALTAASQHQALSSTACQSAVV